LSGISRCESCDTGTGSRPARVLLPCATRHSRILTESFEMEMYNVHAAKVLLLLLTRPWPAWRTQSWRLRYYYANHHAVYFLLISSGFFCPHSPITPIYSCSRLIAVHRGHRRDEHDNGRRGHGQHWQSGPRGAHGRLGALRRRAPALCIRERGEQHRGTDAGAST